MRTFFDKATQDEFRQRLEKLTAQSRSEWGAMSPAQMLAHCSAGMQVPIGDLKVKRTFVRLIGWMFKGMITSEKPFSKNSPTAPEFRMTDPKEFEAEKKRFEETFGKLGQGPQSVVCFEHAFFGTMTAEEWGFLMYKHLDHHFRQFGI